MNEITELIEKVAEEAVAAGLDPSAEDLAGLALDKIAKEEPNDEDVVKIAVDLAADEMPDAEPEKIAEKAIKILKEAEESLLSEERRKMLRRGATLSPAFGGVIGAMHGGISHFMEEAGTRGGAKGLLKRLGKGTAAGAGLGLGAGLTAAMLAPTPGQQAASIQEKIDNLKAKKQHVQTYAKFGEFLKSAAFENQVVDRSRQILMLNGFDPNTGERMSKVALARTPEEVKEAASLELLERRGWHVNWNPEYLARFQQEGVK